MVLPTPGTNVVYGATRGVRALTADTSYRFGTLLRTPYAISGTDVYWYRILLRAYYEMSRADMTPPPFLLLFFFLFGFPLFVFLFPSFLPFFLLFSLSQRNGT